MSRVEKYCVLIIILLNTKSGFVLLCLENLVVMTQIKMTKDNLLGFGL